MKKRDELVLIGILILAVAVLLLSSGCKMNIEKFGKSKEAEKEPKAEAEEKPKKEKTADEYLMEMRKRVGIKTEEKKEEAKAEEKKVEEKKVEEKPEQKAEAKTEAAEKEETSGIKAKEAEIVAQTNETKQKEFYMSRFNFLKSTENVGGAVKDVRMKTGEVGYAKVAGIGSPKKYKIRVREFYAAYEYPFYTDDSYHNGDKVNFWLNQTDDVVKVERMN